MNIAIFYYLTIKERVYSLLFGFLLLRILYRANLYKIVNRNIKYTKNLNGYFVDIEIPLKISGVFYIWMSMSYMCILWCFFVIQINKK